MKRIYFLALIVAITGVSVFCVFKVRENIKLKKQLRITGNELEYVQSEFDELSSKLGGQSVEEITDKIDNLQSYASGLESSIDDLLREINFSDCVDCENAIWDIKRKAQDVKSDFESLQSEINN